MGDITGKEFYFKSNKTTITLKGQSLTISRKGIMNAMNHGFSGEKEININTINSVQVKKPGFVTKGYMQFAFTGGTESKRGLTAAVNDENTVLIGSKDELSMVEEIKDYIDKIAYAQPEPQQATSSAADEIKKLKQLLDQDILTQDEFNAKKKELLGL